MIENYTIIAHIGHGAMGSIEKIRAPDGRVLALKTLSPHLAQQEDYIKRFKREAEIAIQLSHPNVVRVFEVGNDDTGIPYIIMEYVEGRTLDALMHEREMDIKSSDITIMDDIDKTVQSSIVRERGSESGPNTFSTQETIKLGRQLAGVLQSACDLHLLHRDIKPQNIMINQCGNAKLLDFGIAKDLSGVYTSLSMTGQAIGTPAYMSPEQYTGAKDIDIRSDLYSLGCTMYHMLTGEPPFRGATITAMVNQHLNTYATPVSKLNKDCPLNMSQVIDRLLAKKPGDRHNSPSELIEDLNRVERGEVPLQLHKRKKSPKHKPLIPLLYAVAAIVIILICFILYNSTNTDRESGVILTGISDAQKFADKLRFNESILKLDVLITAYSDSKPALISKAYNKRKIIIKKQNDHQEKQRQSKIRSCIREVMLSADGQARELEKYKLFVKAYNSCGTNQERQAVALIENKQLALDIAQHNKRTRIIEQAYGLCKTEQERARINNAADKVAAIIVKYKHDRAKIRSGMKTNMKKAVSGKTATAQAD
jgi:serine/threonine protein kinase